MPEWINTNDLMEFFFYFKNKTTHNFTMELHKLLQIAFFFQNYDMINDVIYKEVIPRLKNDNSILYLESSYAKLSNKSETVEQGWFDLFVTALDHVSKNFLVHLNIHYEQLLKVNNLLLEELIEK